MINQKNIIFINDNIVLSHDLVEYNIIEAALFPKLIYQEFLKRLKIPALELAISDSGLILEKYPSEFEQADETIVFKNQLKNAVNKMDLLTYYLLNSILKSDFNLNSIFIENTKKPTLFFASNMPFNSENKYNNPSIVNYLISTTKPKEITDVIDRFFILMNQQFKDKLLTFLTFIETKYNFKLNKKNFIEAAQNQQNLNELNKQLLKQLLK